MRFEVQLDVSRLGPDYGPDQRASRRPTLYASVTLGRRTWFLARWAACTARPLKRGYHQITESRDGAMLTYCGRHPMT